MQKPWYKRHSGHDHEGQQGLESSVAALPGVAHMPAARVFYVAATRAVQRLGTGVERYGTLSEKLVA